MMADYTDSVFGRTRPFLIGLAYRMLGSRADAEDAVQDTFMKWQLADAAPIINPVAWLTTVCTRRCVDMLRSDHKTRTDYVGAWLPEPIHTAHNGEAENAMFLASSLSMAFLLMLERLTPKERAAYLLYEIFEIPYGETASTLGINESACRKLISRARANIGQSKTRYVVPADKQDQLLSTFQDAVLTGDTGKLAVLMSDDIEISQDSGGKVSASVHVLRGRTEAIEFIREFLHAYWQPYAWSRVDLNGGRGILVKQDGVAAATVSFAVGKAAKATNIFITRNPEKLSLLGASAIQ